MTSPAASDRSNSIAGPSPSPSPSRKQQQQQQQQQQRQLLAAAAGGGGPAVSAVSEQRVRGVVYVYDLDGPEGRGFEGVLSALPGRLWRCPTRRCGGAWGAAFASAPRVAGTLPLWPPPLPRLLVAGGGSLELPAELRAAAGFVSSSSPPPRSSKRAAAAEAGGGSSNNEGRLVVDRLSRTAVRVCGPCHNVLTPGDGW